MKTRTVFLSAILSTMLMAAGTDEIGHQGDNQHQNTQQNQDNKQSVIFSGEVKEDIEKLKDNTKDRYEIMNSLKEKMQQMSAEERIQVMSQIRKTMQINHQGTIMMGQREANHHENIESKMYEKFNSMHEQMRHMDGKKEMHMAKMRQMHMKNMDQKEMENSNGDYHEDNHQKMDNK